MAISEETLHADFIAALVAGALGLLVLVLRSIRARMSGVFVLGGIGLVLVGFGLWCSLRPVDMGSYEPNCLPPLIEGRFDERCSEVGRTGAGLALVGAGAFAFVLAARATRPELP